MIFPYAQIAVEADRMVGRWQREALVRIQQRMAAQQRGECYGEVEEAEADKVSSQRAW